RQEVRPNGCATTLGTHPKHGIDRLVRERASGLLSDHSERFRCATISSGKDDSMATEVAARLEPLQHQSAPLRNKIIATLRNAIETGLLAPGARLVERDLCGQLNVSRTSLREALREL